MKKPKVTYSTTAYVDTESGGLLNDIELELNGWATGQDNFCTTTEQIEEGLEDCNKPEVKSFLKAVLKEVSGKAGDVIFHI